MRKQLLILTLTEFKLVLREPIAVFFGFVFPAILLFAIMEIFIPAEAPKEIIINAIIPMLMVMAIASTAIFGIPMTIVPYREIKFFKRLRATPVNPSVVLGGLGIANLIVTLFGILLLVVAGKLVYQARFDGSLLFFSLAFLLSFLSLVSMGFIIASLCRTARVTIAVSQILFFPMLILSGSMGPIPDWIAKYISPFIPLTHARELLQGLWLGEPLADFSKQMLVLLGFLLLGLAVSAKTFRWE